MNKDLSETKPTIAAAASIDTTSYHNLDVSQNIVPKSTKQDMLPSSSMAYKLKRIVSIPSDSIKQMYKETGPKWVFPILHYWVK